MTDERWRARHLLHKMALESLAKRTRNVQFKGFGQMLRKLAPELFEGGRLQVRPDAFKVVALPSGYLLIRCYEVDINCGPSLNGDRLIKYAHLCADVDSSENLYLELVIIDRFGNIEHTYTSDDLTALYLSELQAAALVRSKCAA